MRARAATKSAPLTATVTIESLSHEGRGIAHIDGKVVFVDGALPQEQAEIQITRRHRHYDDARVMQIHDPHVERREPVCRYFGVCGGCSLQHMSSALQLATKQATLAEQLQHVGKAEPQTWLPPLTGPTLGYRRRARLGVRLVPAKGGVLIGFREKRRSYITRLDDCPVLDPVVSGWLPALHALITALSCAESIPQIEVAVGDNARALVFRHLVPLSAEDEALLREFGERHGVQILAQSGGPDSIVALWPSQPEALRYRLPDGGTIEFAPTDFVQVNAGINAGMIEQALRLLDPQPADTVLDLFCGLGNFTLPLARRAGRVLGIEGEASLVERARRNAEANALANVAFRVADLFATSTSAPWDGFVFNKLLLDPPRSGAIEAIRQLCEPFPERIVYVSCNPSTLARDTQHLTQELGYRLCAAGILDMFPHTSHVESMALFERTGK